MIRADVQQGMELVNNTLWTHADRNKTTLNFITLAE